MLFLSTWSLIGNVYTNWRTGPVSVETKGRLPPSLGDVTGPARQFQWQEMIYMANYFFHSRQEDDKNRGENPSSKFDGGNGPAIFPFGHTPLTPPSPSDTLPSHRLTLGRSLSTFSPVKILLPGHFLHHRFTISRRCWDVRLILRSTGTHLSALGYHPV